MIWHGDIQHGAMIAQAANTSFDPHTDRCFSRVSEDGRLLGGFILTNFTGSMMMDHMAGVGSNWCTPELMWVIFDYQFNQLSLKKVMATVSSHHWKTADMVRRAGFELEHSIRDGVPNGNLLLFSMSRDKCKWLRLRDRYRRVNGSNRGEHVHVQA